MIEEVTIEVTYSTGHKQKVKLIGIEKFNLAQRQIDASTMDKRRFINEGLIELAVEGTIVETEGSNATNQIEG